MEMTRELIEGYHLEVTGRGYDILIRESDDRCIARCEGFENDIEDLCTNNYRESDRAALEAFAEFIG